MTTNPLRSAIELELIGKRMKLAGKIGLTALVPAIGLPVMFKKNIPMNFLIGLALSGLFSSGIPILSRKDICNYNPQISIERPERNLGIPSFISPVYALATLKPETKLQEITKLPYMNEYKVEGDDVIVFDGKVQKYVLNFAQNRKFESVKRVRPNGIHDRRYTSVSEAQERVSNLTGELERLTSQGDINEARKVSSELVSARLEYNSVKANYTKTKVAYEAAVAKMNAELDSLKNSGKIKGDKKTPEKQT